MPSPASDRSFPPGPRGARLAGGRAARLLRVLARAGAALRRVTGARAPLSLEQRIAAAGAPAGLGPRELIAAKLATMLFGAAVGTLLGALAPGRLGAVLVVGAPVAAFLVPDWWLKRRAAERAHAARRELPALLDLLRVTVEAGLPPAAAFAAVGERASGTLATEWRTVGRVCTLGVPVGEALAGLERRLPMPEVRALVAALDRAARHGAPLAETLAAQARDARLARRRQIEEEAAKAGPKIQLVVALLLVPSVLLLVAAALAAALLDGGGLAIGAELRLMRSARAGSRRRVPFQCRIAGFRRHTPPGSGRARPACALDPPTCAHLGPDTGPQATHRQPPPAPQRHGQEPPRQQAVQSPRLGAIARARARIAPAVPQSVGSSPTASHALKPAPGVGSPPRARPTHHRRTEKVCRCVAGWGKWGTVSTP